MNSNTAQLKPKTITELIRVIRIEPWLYRVIRSFVESSLRVDYPWRVGYESQGVYTWIKRGKWELKVYKDIEYVSEYEPLPVIGIYRITKTQIPVVAILQSIERPGMFLEFVVLKNENELAILHVAYPYNLAFTENAPIAFLPTRNVPFARPITAREIIDTLSQYVEIS